MSYLKEITSGRLRAQAVRKALPPITAQQAALVHGPVEGIIKVNAFAGAGKTTSLCALASRHADKRCLYLAFSKAAQMDASKRFASSARCLTIHGLAFASFGKKYVHKLGQPRSIDIIRRMGIPWNWQLADAVVQTIGAWCVSDWEEFPKSACAVNGTLTGTPSMLAQAAGIAKQAWQRMCDPAGDMPMSHDGYLKLFQLSQPRIDADLIMLDEGQDTNPVTWAIVRCQACPLVIVGDRYQSIFQFRGAINAMQIAKADREYPFTQSFRFGPRVARIATDLLRMFYREQAAIEGLGPDTLITATPQGSPRAILARTNATVFQHAVKAIRCGQSLGFAGGVNAYGFEKLLDVNHLAQERHDRIRDDLIRTFPSFSHFMEYSKQSGDLEAKRQIEAVLAYGDELETLIPSIHQSAQTDLSKAFIVLATAHRAKGLTLDHVELADDFPELLDAVGAPLQADQLDRQEVNLLYVALTRPRLTLSLNRTTLEFVRKCGASGLLGDSWLVA